MLLETIKIINGKCIHLNLHQKRMNHSREKLLNKKTTIHLKNQIEIPPIYQKGLVKCSISYKEKINQIEFSHYKKRDIKKIKIIHSDTIDYSFKYADRSIFKKLKEGLSPYEEILIVKNNFLSDTSYSNIILFDGKNWITPHSPLLKGIKREFLLKKGLIYEKKISLADLPSYSHIQLINAMLGFKKNIIRLPIKAIET